MTLQTTTAIPQPNLPQMIFRTSYLALNAVIKHCEPVQLQVCYVKGYQEATAMCSLMQAKLHNIECDYLAKLAMCSIEHCPEHHPLNPRIEKMQPHLHIASKVFCYKFLPTLQEATAI